MSSQEVWVLVESPGGAFQDGSLELVGEGRKLADKLGGLSVAVVLGECADQTAAQLARHGAGRVLSISHPALAEDTVDTQAQLLAVTIRQRSPAIVLAVESPRGGDLARRLAARLGTGLVTACDRIDFEDGLLLATKPVYGNQASASFTCPADRPQMATLSADAIDLRTADESATATVEEFRPDIEVAPSGTRTLDLLPGDPRHVALTEAEIVVAGGMGMGTADNFKLVEALAEAIGGSVGASRRAVDEEWVTLDRQVGLTGKTVRPKLYIACGISGAIQHTMGMKDARAIVAINTDRTAPIFKIADVGVVGDVLDVLPALTTRLREAVAESAGSGAVEVFDALSHP
ncbi:MAG: electron transfer flavoprotein subunit alpha/FixB family protein [Dehalococcoidales bacterium]